MEHLGASGKSAALLSERQQVQSDFRADLGARVARFVDLRIHTQITHSLQETPLVGHMGLYCHLVGGWRGTATIPADT